MTKKAKTPWFRKPRPPRLERELAQAGLVDAMARVQAPPPIPAGSRIFTSWSAKVEVAHLKSAVNPGAACDAMSQRTDWLGIGNDEERAHAAALRPCSACARAEGMAAAS